MAAAAVTFKLVTAVLGLSVMVLAAAAESVVTTAEDPAFKVNCVAVVLATRMLFVVAVAFKDPVVNKPTVVTCVCAVSTAEVVAVSGLLRLIAPEAEVKVKLLVLMVPNPASAIVPPDLMVTVFVPLRVPLMVTV